MKMMSGSRILTTMALLAMLLAACAQAAPPAQPPVASPTALPTKTPLPTPTAGPTPTPAPTPIAAEKMPWWNNSVFYEVFVRSFADSTTGPLAGDGIGDLQGLIEHLDYLNDGNPATTTDLGITGIWLMPIMQSPSYHGYDVTDYYTVNRDYGANEDFKRLVAEAHKRGIKVIIDLVLNHTSDQNPWFLDARQPGSAHRDWYIWSDTNPGYLGPWGEEVWHKLGNQWYYGIFVASMPDLNYKTPAVTEEMLKVTRYWLKDMGADGYRLDAIRHLIEEGKTQENTPVTHEWLRKFNQVYKEANPQAVTIGEIWTNSKTVATYIGDQVDLAFEFDLAQAILGSVNNGSAASLALPQAVDKLSFPAGQYATFITNHDQDRTMSQFSGDVTKAKLAATILLTNPGVSFIYYGEEIGMTGQKPDENIRTPMQWTPGQYAGFSTQRPWEPANSGYEQVNVQTENASSDSLLSLYRKLIQLRNAHSALRVGSLVQVETTPSKVSAFLRQSADETVLVILNFGDTPVSDYTLNLAAGQLAGQLKAIELLQGAEASAPAVNDQGGFSDYEPIKELAPRTGYIVQLSP